MGATELLINPYLLEGKGSRITDLTDFFVDAASPLNTAQQATDLSGAGNHGELGSTSGADTNDPLFHSATDLQYGSYLQSGAVSGSYADVGDLPNITGDITVGGCFSTDWSTGSAQALVAQWGSGNSTRAFQLVHNTGTLRFQIRDDVAGSNVTKVATVAIPGATSAAEAKWIEARLDIDTGASDASITFWYSDDAPNTARNSVSWTQIGDAVTYGAAVDVNDVTEDCTFMSNDDGTGNRTVGKCWQGYVGLALDDRDEVAVDFTGQTDWDTSFLDETGDYTVTITDSGAGALTHVVAAPQWTFHTDDYIDFGDVLDGGTNPQTLAVACRSVDWDDALGIFTKRLSAGDLDGFAISQFFGAAWAAWDSGGSDDSANAGTPTDLARSVVVGVRDGTNAVGYLDGTAGTPTTDNGLDTDSAATLQIGAQNGALFFRGAVYSAAIFQNTALTALQVTSLTAEMS